MQTIPVTVLDNFFDNPDKVRTWALQQEYFADPSGRWPGLRSKELVELNEPFFHFVCKKFFAQFYNLDEEIEWVVSMRFQTVHKGYEAGWVHSDEERSQITGIIYLTPNSNLGGGTSIYREKSNLIKAVHQSNDIKINSYLNKITIKEAEEYRKAHNDQFEETIRVANIYNRLVSFDSHLHHSAQSFFGENDDARLTLVFFVTKLLVNNPPVARVRRVTD